MALVAGVCGRVVGRNGSVGVAHLAVSNNAAPSAVQHPGVDAQLINGASTPALRDARSAQLHAVQGYLAHKKPPPPLGGPRG